jgi:hypothetical protein
MASDNNVAVHAFVAWIATVAAYIIFLLWSLTPEHYLRSFGLTYYPPKFLALYLPVYLLLTYVYLGIVYVSWNMINTRSAEDIRTLKCANFTRASSAYVKCGLKDGIPDIGDIDPAFVSYYIANTAMSSATASVTGSAPGTGAGTSITSSTSINTAI